MDDGQITIEWLGEVTIVPYVAAFEPKGIYTLRTSQVQKYIDNGQARVAKAKKPAASETEE